MVTLRSANQTWRSATTRIKINVLRQTATYYTPVQIKVRSNFAINPVSPNKHQSSCTPRCQNPSKVNPHTTSESSCRSFSNRRITGTPSHRLIAAAAAAVPSGTTRLTRLADTTDDGRARLPTSLADGHVQRRRCADKREFYSRPSSGCNHTTTTSDADTWSTPFAVKFISRQHTRNRRNIGHLPSVSVYEHLAKLRLMK